MGTHFKRSIFDDQVQTRLIGWAQKAKKKGLRGDSNQSVQGSSHNGGSTNIQLGSMFRRGPAPENNAIVPQNEESVWTCSHVTKMFIIITTCISRKQILVKSLELYAIVSSQL